MKAPVTRPILILGGLAFVTYLGFFLVSAFAEARDSSKGEVCIVHIKTLGDALLLYAADHDSHLPPAENWRTGSARYLTAKGPFRCPFSNAPYTYAFNQAMSKQNLAELTGLDHTVLLFESDGIHPNLAGGPANIRKRHGSRSVVYEASGAYHVVGPSFKPVWKPAKLKGE